MEVLLRWEGSDHGCSTVRLPYPARTGRKFCLVLGKEEHSLPNDDIKKYRWLMDDFARRALIAKNHTTTHMLNLALWGALGQAFGLGASSDVAACGAPLDCLVAGLHSVVTATERLNLLSRGSSDGLLKLQLLQLPHPWDFAVLSIVVIRGDAVPRP